MTVVDFPQQGTIGATLKPKRYDIEMYQDDTFRFAMKFLNGVTPVDLTGWTALAQIRQVVSGVVGVTVEGAFTATIPVPADGIVYLDFDSGTLDPGNYAYDVQMTDGASQRRTYIGGKVTVTFDISE